MFKILSIDGGGIRGIIPAMVMVRMEELTGKRIAELFDFIAGTSTGGILALGLTVPGANGGPAYSAREGVELYEKQGGRIFSRPFWRKVTLISWLMEEKYPSHHIEEVLGEYFGEARLKDAVKEVLVTSYDIERSRPYFFKRRMARAGAGRDALMRSVARATSAAPAYFEPAKLQTDGSSEYRALVDGGVFANNPAMCAWAEARRMDVQPEEILLVSLGTGELTRKLRYEEVKGWGLVQWARPLLDVVFDGVSDAVDYQLSYLMQPKNGQRRYYRFQVELSEDTDATDDASPENIQALKRLADGMITKEGALLTELCGRLASG